MVSTFARHHRRVIAVIMGGAGRFEHTFSRAHHHSTHGRARRR